MDTFSSKNTRPDPVIGVELLEEFRELYRAEFGEAISEDEALEKSIHLIGLFRAIYRPIPVDREDVYRDLEM